jgi:hypothetical protein
MPPSSMENSANPAARLARGSPRRDTEQPHPGSYHGRKASASLRSFAIAAGLPVAEPAGATHPCSDASVQRTLGYSGLPLRGEQPRGRWRHAKDLRVILTSYVPREQTCDWLTSSCANGNYPSGMGGICWHALTGCSKHEIAGFARPCATDPGGSGKGSVDFQTREAQLEKSGGNRRN